jgi:tetratricopeptide (TPR) repeat protein
VARNNRAWAFAYLGRPGDARRAILETIELTRAEGDHASLSGALGTASEIARLVGDTASATSYARLEIEHFEKTGPQGPRPRAGALVRLGAAHVLRREWLEAIDVLEQALGVARQHALVSEGDVLAHLALAQLGSGDVRKARETALEAAALTAKRGNKLHEPHARIVLARVLIQSDGPTARSAIEAELDRAEALIEEMGARLLAPLALEERARLARLFGDEAGFERELREAQRLYTEMGATGHAERLARELG